MTILQERASTARRAMIDSQLRVSGVNDPAVLAAIGRVPREDFVPAAQRDHAYIDRAIPLGDGHFLPAPLCQGLALCEAQLQPGETVLVVAASGYLAALAAELGATVRTATPVPAGLAAQLAEGGRIVTGKVERGVTRLAVGTATAGSVALLSVADIGIPVLPEFAAPTRWSF